MLSKSLLSINRQLQSLPPLLFMISLLLVLSLNLPTYAEVASELEIAATTNKTLYNLGETIQISGTLTLNGSLVPEGLVAVQVNDPSNRIVVMRTLPTPLPPANLTFEIVEVLPIDWQGNPKDAFTRGTSAYFKVTLRNGGTVSRDVTLTFNVYDVNMVTLGVQWIRPPPIPPGVEEITLSFPISNTASLGKAIVCVNAYRSLPQVGGTPYCPENSATFTIVSGYALGETTSGSQIETAGSNGSFSMTFKLPSYNGAELGIYPIYLTSITGGRPDTLLLTFRVQLKADLNKDLIVDIYDVVTVAKAFGCRPGDANWNSLADLNDDDVVDIYDVVLVSLDFGKIAT